MEDKDSFILQSQYHGGWWPGDSQSQGINNYGFFHNIPVSAPHGVNTDEDSVMVIYHMELTMYI